ncbi:hypothetical protein PENTCL1PPCAC_12219, partial [Pristionchus entomophagus]
DVIVLSQMRSSLRLRGRERPGVVSLAQELRQLAQDAARQEVLLHHSLSLSSPSLRPLSQCRRPAIALLRGRPAAQQLSLHCRLHRTTRLHYRIPPRTLHLVPLLPQQPRLEHPSPTATGLLRRLARRPHCREVILPSTFTDSFHYEPCLYDDKRESR